LRACARSLVGSASKLPSDRHVVLPHGIETPPALAAEDRRAIRADLKVSAEQCLVLFVGRIVRAKGVFELLDAVDVARRERTEVVCVLIGAQAGFDDAENVRHKLREHPDLARHVQLLPACAPEQVWRYLHAADVFAFPSHSEGMPNSLLEAMAVGLPAVAYAIPPIVELDSGVGALELVPKRDVPTLARVLGELAQSPERRRCLGEKGRAHVLNRFLAQTQIAEAMRRLKSVIDRHSADSSIPTAVTATKIRPT
jgi:glycosyltransferase involved in cell wall biosynthesis